MNEFFKKLLTKGTALWAGWSMQQRIIIGVVIIVCIGGVIALFRVSSTPIMVAVIDAPIRDEAVLNRIVLRLNQEDVRVTVTPTGLIQVADTATARRMRMILISEGLVPSGIDPWAVFDRERWTITDFERNVNFQRAQRQLVIDHIKAIDAVDDVNVIIQWPARELFRSDQRPVTASVIITPKPGSNITQSPQNRRQIEGIQTLLQFAIEGIQTEHIVITDHTGQRLNDFESMAESDRLSMLERGRRIIQREEEHLRRRLLSSLQHTFSADRIRDINVSIDMDLSRRNIETIEYLPFVLRPRTPGLPYDDSEISESVLRSTTVSETEWVGTGYNPEGPAGVEGHVPPAFRDMSNLYGRMIQRTSTRNEEINQRNMLEERTPQIDRITVSVNIDGVWRRKFDERGNPVILPDGSIEREYTAVPIEVLRDVDALIRDGIGFDSARMYSVTVRNIPFDRTTEFREQDEAYFRQKQLQTTIIVFISGLTLLLFGFMLFRVISREMDRRRRIADEERARREQMMRESAMAAAEHDGGEVSISFEERTRMELMENAINMAKEHPEDAAQLIRTWILEE
jgi:flagellar M-ring protein FliF